MASKTWAVSSAEETARTVLDRYGTTYADEAGIPLGDAPAPLFQLLVLAELLSARIGAGVAVATAHELSAAGWTTPQRMRDAPRPRVVAALGRGGYRRYDERTATQLRELGSRVLERYEGDLRGLAQEAAGDVDRQPGCCRSSTASARPARRSSSARCRASGRGLSPIWTTAPGWEHAAWASRTTSRRWPVSCHPPISPGSPPAWSVSP